MENRLTKYLSDAVEIESSLYGLNEMLNLLAQRYNSMREPRLEVIKLKEKPGLCISDLILDFSVVVGMGLIAGGMLMPIALGLLHIIFKFKFIGFYASVKLGVIVGGVLGFLLWLLFSVSCRNDEKREVEKHNQEAETTNERNQKNYDAAIRLYKRNRSELRQEWNLIQKQRNELTEIREKFYSVDILYPKYRNFVAVCTILEYLKSGRCTSLAGASGAYNLYEADLKANLIINRLDIVISRLETIADNQYLLYNELVGINNTNNRLVSTIDSALRQTNERLSNIADNAEVQAYNSKVIADNSNFMALVDSYYFYKN